MAIAGVLWLLFVSVPLTLSAKVLIAHDTACGSGGGYTELACEAGVNIQQKYPNDVIYDEHIAVSDCVTWGAANASGHHLLIFVGFTYEACSLALARDHPSVWVTIIDSCPTGSDELSNFICGTFLEDQPAFITGYLAGLISTSKVTGIIGGTPLPSVQRLFNGFITGVRTSCPDCRVEGAYVNSFFHPANAVALATYLVTDLGADVVFGCAGGTGSSGIVHAAGLGASVIGVDVDEFETTFASRPQDEREKVVTSAIKRVGVAIDIFVSLLLPLNVGDTIPGLTGTQLLFDYANSGVGTADCHQACGLVGQVAWSSMKSKEIELASRVTSTGLSGSGWDVPLRPVSAEPNRFYSAPNPAQPPVARIQSSMAALSTGWATEFLVMFGGKDAAGTVFNDLWLYNVQSGKWLDSMHGMTHGTPPPALAKSCAVGMELNTVIFGGRTGGTTPQQSDTVYRFTYQPDFLGFSDSTSANIRHEWSTLTNAGDVPVAVEAPGCVQLSTSCMAVFGGRSNLAHVNTLHQLCVSGSVSTWTVLQATNTGPDAREGAGLALVNTTLLGLPAGPGDGTALIVVGGVAGGAPKTDVWVLHDPLGTDPVWSTLPADLPEAVEGCLVLVADAPQGTAPGAATKVLAVQPSSALPGTGFNSFTYDPERQTWNTQGTNFDPNSRAGTRQATLGAAKTSAGDYVWLFGGTVNGTYQNDLSVSVYQVQTICTPGEQSQGAGCESCSVGRFSAGGVGASCEPCNRGTFANTTGTSACAACPAGRYGDEQGLSQCPRCPKGTYSGAGLQQCTVCDYGTYGENEGATSFQSCTQCGAGKYAGTQGNTAPDACTDCEPGRAAEERGQQQCNLCSAGSFSGSGDAVCTLCSKGSYQSARGQSSCSSCEEVLTTGTTEVRGATSAVECICPVDMYRPGNSSGACSACPEGMTCAEGSDMDHYAAKLRGEGVTGKLYPILQRRYWSDPGEPLEVFLCENRDLCPGGDPGTCSNAKTKGISCGRCAEKYYPTSEGCQPCTDLEATRILFPLTPVLLAPPLICIMYYFFRDLPEKWGSWQNSLSGLMFILLNHYQMISLMQSVNVELPTSVSDTFDVWAVSQDAISIFNTDCAGFGGFFVAFLSRSMTPVSFLVMCLVTYLGTHIYSRLFGQAVAMEADRLVNVFLSIVYAFFTGIASLSLALFKCQRNPGGRSTLMRDRAIICYEDEWTSALGVAICAVLVYCIGCVLLFGYIIYVAPSRFAELSFQKRWKFLFIKYRPDVHWWSMVVLMKGVLLNVGTVAFASTPVQLYWIFLMMLAYVVLAICLCPWRRYVATLMDIFVHLAAMTAVSITTYFGDADSDVRRNMGTFLIVVTCSPFFFCSLAGVFIALPALHLCGVLERKWEQEAVSLLATVSNDFVKLDDQERQILFSAIGAHDQLLLVGAMRAMRAELTAGQSGGTRLVTRNTSDRVSKALASREGSTRSYYSGGSVYTGQQGDKIPGRVCI